MAIYEVIAYVLLLVTGIILGFIGIMTLIMMRRLEITAREIWSNTVNLEQSYPGQVIFPEDAMGTNREEELEEEASIG